VATREEGTVFRRPEDLLAVPGIGAVTLERIRPALDLGLQPPPHPIRGPEPPAPASGARVDVNTAGIAELQSLPGIGPALAARIVEAREEQMFTSLDDLVRVRGIGEATVERLRAHASVGGVARRVPR
jgi:competence ComEA-like helix-hairpin-helix protein